MLLFDASCGSLKIRPACEGWHLHGVRHVSHDQGAEFSRKGLGKKRKKLHDLVCLSKAVKMSESPLAKRKNGTLPTQECEVLPTTQNVFWAREYVSIRMIFQRTISSYLSSASLLACSCAAVLALAAIISIYSMQLLSLTEQYLWEKFRQDKAEKGLERGQSIAGCMHGVWKGRTIQLKALSEDFSQRQTASLMTLSCGDCLNWMSLFWRLP